MKREIITIVRNTHGCCAGHDKWTVKKLIYKNNKSIKAFSKHKKREHRYCRRIIKSKIKEIENYEMPNL